MQTSQSKILSFDASIAGGVKHQNSSSNKEENSEFLSMVLDAAASKGENLNEKDIKEIVSSVNMSVQQKKANEQPKEIIDAKEILGEDAAGKLFSNATFMQLLQILEMLNGGEKISKVMDKKQLSLRAADNIRILALSMVEKAKSGHPGGAMGGADFAQVLFGEYMVFDPERPEWFARDRFFLDPGHMSPMLYATLSMHGKYSMEDLKSFRQWESVTPGHPERDVKRGVENTSGPLGQGHTYAVGAAIAAKKMEAKFGKIMRQRIFAFISDGGIQEEISQGAGRIAGHLGLDNLVMFYDANNIQLSTTVDEVTSEDVAMKYKAWGWEVIEINGNDHDQIRKALDKAIVVKGKPTLIIGKTLMGKGAVDADGKSFENKVSSATASLALAK